MTDPRHTFSEAVFNIFHIGIAERHCGCCKVVLTEDDAEKRMASVLPLFGLGLFSSSHSTLF